MKRHGVVEQFFLRDDSGRSVTCMHASNHPGNGPGITFCTRDTGIIACDEGDQTCVLYLGHSVPTRLTSPS